MLKVFPVYCILSLCLLSFVSCTQQQNIKGKFNKVRYLNKYFAVALLQQEDWQTMKRFSKVSPELAAISKSMGLNVEFMIQRHASPETNFFTGLSCMVGQLGPSFQKVNSLSVWQALINDYYKTLGYTGVHKDDVSEISLGGATFYRSPITFNTPADNPYEGTFYITFKDANALAFVGVSDSQTGNELVEFFLRKMEHVPSDADQAKGSHMFVKIDGIKNKGVHKVKKGMTLIEFILHLDVKIPPYAQEPRIKVHREVNGEDRVYTIDLVILFDKLHQKDLENFVLQNGDVLQYFL